MRQWILILVLGVLLAIPNFALAQQPVTIESAGVELWPEYDEAGQMLVINYVTLSAESPIPTTVDIRIPAKAKLHTVAVGATIETVSDANVNSAIKNEGGWQVLSVEATAPAILVEYYDPALKIEGKSRAYTYQWLSDYETKNFDVIVQQPFDASGMTSSLNLQNAGVRQNMLQYFSADAGEVQAGTTLSFDIGYEKETDAISISQIQEQQQVQVQPSAPLDKSASGKSSSAYLPYIIGGVGLLLIIGGVFYYLQTGKNSGQKSRRRGIKKSDAENENGDIYCAQCGTRARSGDRFCRTCGSRLRQTED